MSLRLRGWRHGDKKMNEFTSASPRVLHSFAGGAGRSGWRTKLIYDKVTVQREATARKKGRNVETWRVWAVVRDIRFDLFTTDILVDGWNEREEENGFDIKEEEGEKALDGRDEDLLRSEEKPPEIESCGEENGTKKGRVSENNHVHNIRRKKQWIGHWTRPTPPIKVDGRERTESSTHAPVMDGRSFWRSLKFFFPVETQKVFENEPILRNL